MLPSLCSWLSNKCQYNVTMVITYSTFFIDLKEYMNLKKQEIVYIMA